MLRALILSLILAGTSVQAAGHQKTPTAEDWAVVLGVCTGGTLVSGLIADEAITISNAALAAVLFPVLAGCVIIYGEHYLNTKGSS